MFPVLERIDGITSDTMLLLWSMKEKDTVIRNLNSTLIRYLKYLIQHLRSQYDELFPSLYKDRPDIFPPELYPWEHFLWACELWYSNSMKVVFPDGKLRTCLIPIAGFLNHSICPHIMHYGKVDSTKNCLKFPLSRQCNAGEQCFLSYGRFSSSHLITFYGFLPQADNPYDVIPLDIDVPNVDHLENGGLMSNWTSHMVRGTWLSKNHEIFHYGLPSPLLDHFCRARVPTLQPNSLTQENLETELEILKNLCSTFEDMLQGLCETNPVNGKNSSWDVKLASEFKDLQRRMISSIVTSCRAGCKLVEHELSKCMGWTVASSIFA